MVGGADGRSHFGIPQDSFVYLSRVRGNVLYVRTSLFGSVLCWSDLAVDFCFLEEVKSKSRGWKDAFEDKFGRLERWMLTGCYRNFCGVSKVTK